MYATEDSCKAVSYNYVFSSSTNLSKLDCIAIFNIAAAITQLRLHQVVMEYG